MYALHITGWFPAFSSFSTIASLSHCTNTHTHIYCMIEMRRVRTLWHNKRTHTHSHSHALTVAVSKPNPVNPTTHCLRDAATAQFHWQPKKSCCNFLLSTACPPRNSNSFSNSLCRLLFNPAGQASLSRPTSSSHKIMPSRIFCIYTECVVSTIYVCVCITIFNTVS